MNREGNVTDAERLASWLFEWRLARAMEAVGEKEESPRVTADEPGAGRMGWPVASVELEAPPTVGQIRLMSPELTGRDEGPLHVGLLAEPTPGQWWIAPFGRFSVAALPGELELDRESIPLRVCCVWNARTLSAAVVAISWVVDTLTPAECADAREVLAHLETQAPLPAPLRRRTGPPLLHPDDPRVAYRLRARLQMDDFQRRAASLYLDDRGDDALPRAAESPPPETP